MHQGWEDAALYFKEFSGRVDVKELLNRKVGEAFVQMNNRIVFFSTFPPRPVPKKSYKDEIIELSRNKYCVKIEKDMDGNIVCENESKSEIKYDEI